MKERRSISSTETPRCLVNPSSMLEQLRLNARRERERSLRIKRRLPAMTRARGVVRSRTTEAERPAETVLVTARVIESWENPPGEAAPSAPVPEAAAGHGSGSGALLQATPVPAESTFRRRNGGVGLSRGEMLRDIAAAERMPAATPIGRATGARALEEDFLRSLGQQVRSARTRMLDAGVAAPVAAGRAPGAVLTVDPELLTAYVSQWEDDSRISAAAAHAYLREPQLLAMATTLRDQVVGNWAGGGAPLNLQRFFEMGNAIAQHAPTAMLLCHNVARSFAMGGNAIHWQKKAPRTGNVYTSGSAEHTARVIHPDGRLIPLRGGPSIFYLLFSAPELGTDDPNDWYHFFLTGTVAIYGAAGKTVRAASGHNAYSNIVYGVVTDVQRSMRDGAVAASPAYDGWLWANSLSFLEGGRYGGAQDDVVRESTVHRRGAAFGVLKVGSLGAGWTWRIPLKDTIAESAALTGVDVAASTYQIVDTAGAVVATAPASGSGGSAPAERSAVLSHLDVIGDVAQLQRSGAKVSRPGGAHGHGVRVRGQNTGTGAAAYPAQIRAYWAQPASRLYHHYWHMARAAWDELDSGMRNRIRQFGFTEPPRRAATETRNADLGAGVDFLYMHRRMIEATNAHAQANGLSYRVQGWNPIPFDHNDPAWPMPAFTGSNPPFFKRQSETDSYRDAVANSFWNAQWLAARTLDEVGTAVENSIHNWMHMHWSVFPQTGNPRGTAPTDDYLGDPYSASVNPTFWKLHGWIDDVIGRWERAAVDAGTGPARSAANEFAVYNWVGPVPGSPPPPPSGGTAPASRSLMAAGHHHGSHLADEEIAEHIRMLEFSVFDPFPFANMPFAAVAERFGLAVGSPQLVA
jgi:hypothetical protein